LNLKAAARHATALWTLVACTASSPPATSQSGMSSTTPSSSDTGPTTDSGPVPTSTPDDCIDVDGEVALDPYGGDLRVSLEATGWFRVEPLCDRWWFVTPEGHPMWSAGVNTATPWGSAAKTTGEYAYHDTVEAVYGSDDAWADAAAARLRSWGFNTAGSWSDADLLGARMPFAVNLRLSGGDWETGDVADWFDPAWEETVTASAQAAAAAHGENPRLIGWFIDNEIRWGPDWRGLDTLLQLYLSTGPETPGKQAAVDLLLSELGSVSDVNVALETDYADREAMLSDTGDWDPLNRAGTETAAKLTTAFLEMAAEQYFSTTTSAIRAVDPDHLILGNREVSVMTRSEVWAVQATHVDVFSANNYVFVDGVAEAALGISGGLDPADGFAALHTDIDLPILITEFGFRAADAGLANSWPPIYPTFDTQTDRAAAFAAYSRQYQAVPWIVGHHWFQWVDQPADGRFDGEDNNWGLVSEADAPYETVTTEMTAVHAEIHGLLRQPR